MGRIRGGYKCLRFPLTPLRTFVGTHLKAGFCEGYRYIIYGLHPALYGNQISSINRTIAPSIMRLEEIFYEQIINIIDEK